MEEQFLNVKEAAVFLSLSERWLYKLAKRRIIPSYKPQKKLYFKKADLINYISNGVQG